MQIIDCEQGSPEWFAARRGIPTGTDFEDIITAKTGELSASAEGLINRLIDEQVRPGEFAVTFTGNVHTERGKELEPIARRTYEFVTACRVDQVGFVLRDDGKAGCSPDGIVAGVRGVEIKCPDGPTHIGYMRGEILPAKYRQQVHGSMTVTGFREWDFVSFCPGYPLFVVRVPWDAYTDKVSAALEQFLIRLEAARRQLGLAA